MTNNPASSIRLSGWSFLAGVGDGLEALFAGPGEDRLELGRRMALFTGIEANGDDPVAVGHRLRQCFEGLVLIEVAKETEDQVGADPPLVGARSQRLRNTIDDGCEGNAAARVGLRIEEDLDVADVLVMGPFQVGHRQIEEIDPVQEHGCTLVVEVEEILQVGKIVSRAGRLDRGVGKGDTVAFGEREHHLRFQGPFDVQMQFRFRQRADELAGRGHGA